MFSEVLKCAGEKKKKIKFRDPAENINHHQHEFHKSSF